MKKYNGKGLKCQDRNREITTSYHHRQNRFNIGKLMWYIADNRWEQREAKSKRKPPSPLHPSSSTSSHWGAHGSRELGLLPSPCSPLHHSQLGSAQHWVPLEPHLAWGSCWALLRGTPTGPLLPDPCYKDQCSAQGKWLQHQQEAWLDTWTDGIISPNCFTSHLPPKRQEPFLRAQCCIYCLQWGQQDRVLLTDTSVPCPVAPYSRRNWSPQQATLAA